MEDNLLTDSDGISKSDLPRRVEGGKKQARPFIPNPKNLSEKAVESINAGVF
jgi:hypothetical protein